MRKKLPLRFAGGSLVVGLLTAFASMPALADVHLPAIESDNMVLQAGSEPQLFGSALAGEVITITFGKRTVSTRADGAGKWQVRLPKLKAGENFDIVVAGKNTVTIKNVLVGEVWLCSGQSNMEFALSQANDHEKEVWAAGHDQIRLFNVKRHMATAPADDVEGSWSVCEPKTAAPFSAVGYFFGRALSQDLNTPVGLIESAYGGTPAQAWTSLDGLEADPVTQKRYWIKAKEQLNHLNDLSQAYEKSLSQWKESQDKVQGQPASEPPKVPKDLIPGHGPSSLFNGMIAPIVSYTIGGVIWYQGESNAGKPDETMAYRRLFPALIKDWRKQFNQPELPFLFVQLANFSKREDANERSPWAELREAQLLSLSVPHTGMAVAIDIGEEKDIHPKNKLEVGRRLERIALAEVYGKHVIFSGPIFSHLDIKDNKAICFFDHTDKGLNTKDGGKVLGFVICGEDKKFVAADGEIAGNTVIVTSSSISRPVAVRYAWAGDPLNNLYNGAGLPASPFRSDVEAAPEVVDLPVTK